MFYADQHMSLEAWRFAVTDATSMAVQVVYPRAEETIADYDLATGGSGSLDSFLDRARRQTRTDWNDLLVGTIAAAHFRASFGVRAPN